MLRQVHGFLLLDKPANMTSNSALQRVKKLFNAIKAGHSGSLDPIATGMLPICFGEATKFSQFLLESDKAYEVIAKLGAETSTGDVEGSVIQINSTDHVTSLCVERVLKQFEGEIDQVPPMYSALKYHGKPLYQWARRGVKIERKARCIKIYSLKFKSFIADELSFTVHCSKGTYIRSLVEDIGKKLRCGAHVIGLRRIMVNPYQHARMHTLSTLISLAEQSDQDGLFACLLPIETAVQSLPFVTLTDFQLFYLRKGQSVCINNIAHTLVRCISENGKFLGVGVIEGNKIRSCRLIKERIEGSIF